MQRRGLHGCNLRFHPTGASPGRGERPPPGAVIHVRRGSLPGPGRGTGWLDGDRDDGSSGSNVQHMYSNCCTYENGRNGENSGNGGQDPGRDRSRYTHVQQNERRESIPGKTTGEGVPAAVGVPVFPALLHMNRRNPRIRAERPILALTGHHSVAATAVHLLHIAATAANQPPRLRRHPGREGRTRVCSRRCGSCRAGEHISATTAFRRRSGRRWCSPSRGCSTTGRLNGRRWRFAGAMSAGRGGRPYRSQEAQAKIGGGCYAKLVREGTTGRLFHGGGA